MKLYTKMLLSFAAMVILIAAMSAINFWKLRDVVGILTEITERNALEIRSATEVERFALRTILEGKKYLLDGEKDAYASTMKHIEQIRHYLNQQAEIADRYNREELAQKVEEARKATTAYENLFSRGAILLEGNRSLEWTMRLKAREVQEVWEAYRSNRSKALNQTFGKGDGAGSIFEDLNQVDKIRNAFFEARRQEKNYLLYKEQEYFDGLMAHLNTLGRLCDQHEKRTANPTHIRPDREALRVYRKAVEQWRANKDELQNVLGQMAAAGERVQKAAMSVQDINWQAMDKSKDTAYQEIRAANRLMVGAPLISIVLGGMLAITFFRRFSKPIVRLVEGTRAIAAGDLSHTVDVKSTDEVGLLADSFNTMAESLNASNETSRNRLEEVHLLSQDLQGLNEGLKSANEELQIARDQSERRAGELEKAYARLQDTQSQLVESAKMAAIGRMAGGVAHEINNPLTGITGYASLLLMDEGLNPKIRKKVQNVLELVERISVIVKDVLFFAHGGEKRKLEYFDLNERIEAIVRLMGTEFRDIEIRRKFAEVLPVLYGDGGQIQQVILNLLTNARDAIRASGKGSCVRITTLREADKVLIRVEDDGPGIPEEIRSRIFDPFFTTKKVGEGTGLGLSISYRIVRDHGGRIRIEGEEGQGTCFVIELPIRKASAKIGEVVEASEAGEAKPSKGKILVVDDDTFMVDLIRDALELLDYSVDIASNGEEALHILEEKTYDVILLDVEMPWLRGDALYEEIEKRRPSLPERVAFVTGDTGNRETSAFLERTRRPYLLKPFDIRRLQDMVAEMMQGENQSAMPNMPEGGFPGALA